MVVTKPEDDNENPYPEEDESTPRPNVGTLHMLYRYHWCIQWNSSNGTNTWNWFAQYSIFLIKLSEGTINFCIT